MSTSSFIDPSAVVTGNVTSGDQTYIGPFARVEARNPFRVQFAGQDNLQDNAVVLAARHDVSIGMRTSLAHGARIIDSSAGDFVFVGFNAHVEDAVIADGSMVLHGARVVGVTIPKDRVVPPGAVISSQSQIGRLPPVSEANIVFKDEVVAVNTEFADSYRQMSSTADELCTQSVVSKPKTSWSPDGTLPSLGKNVRLAGPARIIGGVYLGDGCSLGRRTSVRGDEGGPIVIGSGAVIGNQVTFHSLLGHTIRIGDQLAAGDRVVFHGGLTMGSRVSVGEGAVVFNSTLGSQITIGKGAIIMGIELADGARVPDGARWLCQADVVTAH